MSNNPQSTPPEEVELETLIRFARYCNGLTPYKLNEPLDPIVEGAIQDFLDSLYRWREAYAEKARIEEAENARKYFTKPVIELDQRISVLRKQQGGLERQSDEK